MKRTSSGLSRRRLLALSAAGTGALLLPGGFSGVARADAGGGDGCGSRGATFTAVLRDGAPRAAARATQLTATDSTYVRGGTPYSTENFGGQSTMVVRNGVGAADEISLLKFDTSTVAGSVKRAVLWLNGRVAGAAGSQTQLAAYALSGSAWSEGTVTYATAPSLAAELGSGTISSLTDWVGLDVTKAFVGGAAEVAEVAGTAGVAGAVAAFGVWGVPGGLAVAGPQGIAESYSSKAVPALAPGGSFSTTLDVTVPSSETDQTALLQINYGSGFRRLTVIVQ